LKITKQLYKLLYIEIIITIGVLIMEHHATFAEVLEAADMLSLEEQESLLEILHRRVIDKERAELVKDIKEAQKEFKEGKSRPASPDELMKEILS
jgi:hypothetical protein